MTGPVILIAPRLGRWSEAGLDPDSLSRLAPHLARLLRHARRSETPVAGLDALLGETLGLSGPGLPWARALQTRVAGAASEHGTSRFGLFHMRVDLRDALAHPVALSEEESSRIINELNREFEPDSHFVARAPGDGLCGFRRINAPTGLPPLRDILGQPLAAWTRILREQGDWFRLHNELQMFLYLHPVNRQREQAGQPVINGLWCWGGDPVNTEWRGCAFSDDTEVRDLLALLGADSGDIADFSGQGDLLVWTAWQRSLQQAEALDPAAALRRLDQQVIAPLLRQGRALRLLTGDGARIDYRPADRWRFWRRGCDWTDLGRHP